VREFEVSKRYKKEIIQAEWEVVAWAVPLILGTVAADPVDDAAWAPAHPTNRYPLPSHHSHHQVNQAAGTADTSST
jgi:hypothetical protein